jgi:hypothetical protein
VIIALKDRIVSLKAEKTSGWRGYHSHALPQESHLHRSSAKSVELLRRDGQLSKDLEEQWRPDFAAAM